MKGKGRGKGKGSTGSKVVVSFTAEQATFLKDHLSNVLKGSAKVVERCRKTLSKTTDEQDRGRLERTILTVGTTTEELRSILKTVEDGEPVPDALDTVTMKTDRKDVEWNVTKVEVEPIPGEPIPKGRCSSFGTIDGNYRFRCGATMDGWRVKKPFVVIGGEQVFVNRIVRIWKDVDGKEVAEDGPTGWERNDKK